MQSKILSAIGGNPEQFTISFMGSSVTAGHDSPFNKSFPILTGELMSLPFAAAGIKIVSLNAAMGNNPCMPYDVCVRTFSGPEADIVHWEQSYNCDGSNNQKRVEFEQFIRQSLALPSQPVVVFSTSDTPNWDERVCDNAKSPKIPQEDKDVLTLVKSDPIKIVSDYNYRSQYINKWQAVLDMFKLYKVAGIQMWNHGSYEDYKCFGPYVKGWKCCSASW